MRQLVLDTNIVLDLFVFDDESVTALRTALESHELRWLATTTMREELSAVLAYPLIQRRMAAAQKTAAHVLELFDTHSTLVDAPPECQVKCRDPDDQKFVDLAAAHAALLLSKDAHVLALHRKLTVAKVFSAQEPSPKSDPRGPSANTA